LTLEQQIYAALTSDAGIQAVIGSNLFLVQLPPNPTYPCAAFQRISTNPIYSHSPSAGQQGTVGWCRFQFTCWATGATSGQSVEAFAAAILAALQTFNAWAVPMSPEVAIDQAPNFVIGRRMGIEPQLSPPVFKTIIDVKIWYRDQ
jgi:hypothetical protein